MNITELAQTLTNDIYQYGHNADRSQQSRDGIMGPSDIGFCRQRAVLMTKGIPQSDEVSIAAAQIGTAIHSYIGAALKQAHPDWIVDEKRITATLPSGVEISGTPDIIAPDLNAIIDIKTVDGFGWVKREGTSQNHKYQRHLYALAAIQNDLLDGTQTVYVGNLYIDRSGKEPEPYLIIEPMDAALTDQIDSWIQDVIYAVKHNEDASRDIPAPVCERICPYFTTCRGALEVYDGTEMITDPVLLDALDMYLEGRELEGRGSDMKKAAQQQLVGINGRSTTHQVRWVEVQPTVVSSFEKAGYMRMDVRKVRR